MSASNKVTVCCVQMTRASLASWVIALFLLVLCFLVFVLEDQYQASITSLIVLLTVLLSFTWCVSLAKSGGQTDWFHPAVLFTGLYLVYFVFSGLWFWAYHGYDSEFIDLGPHAALLVNEAFCLGFLSIAAYGLGARTYLASRGLFHRPACADGVLSLKPGMVGSVSHRELVIVALLFGLIGTSFKIYHLSRLGGLSSNLLLYLSPAAENDLGLGISQFVILMESMLDWAVLLAVLLLILRYKATGRAYGLWWVVAAVVLASTLDYVISGKRSSVIFFILLPVIWYHYLVKRLTGRSALTLLMAGVGAIVLLLMGRIVLPLLTQGLVPTDYIGKNSFDVLAFYLDSGEISTFDMIVATIARRHELLLQAGGSLVGFFKFTFSSLTIFIPRVIWPDKPVDLDLSQIYFRVLIGPDENNGIAPTIWGAGYLLFDAVGFAILMFIVGWFFEAGYRLLRPKHGDVPNVVFYSIIFWLMFQAIRFGTMGFVTILVVQSMLTGLLAIWFLGRRRGVKNHIAVAPV